MKYTKGEWKIVEHGITNKILCGKYQVAEGIYNKANARLIAAAPAMYEALKKVSKLELGYLNQVVEQVLAKAEGKNDTI